jgi:GPH family glycoside/pentoside/hexuronide:cation symporter
VDVGIITEPIKNKERKGISTKKMVFFSIQPVISGFLFALWGQIQFFAVNLLLVSQVYIIFIYLLYSLVDAFNDPILGFITDRSKRFTLKYGKRFPWIMIGVIGAPIILILSFIQVSTSLMVIILWLILTMVIYESFMTLYEISHTSLFPDLFRGMGDRGKVTRIAGIIGPVTAILTAISIPLFIAILGGENSLTAYLGTGIIVIIIVYILVIPYNFGVREPDEMKKFRAELDETGKASSPIKDIVRRALTDKNWMAVTIAFFCWAVAGACMMTGLNFFVMHNLGLGIGDTALPSLTVSIVAIIFVPIWIQIAKKIGIKKTYTLSLILNTITFLVFFFVSDYIGLVIVYTYAGIGYSANYGAIFNLASAEAIDNAVVNSGKREEASYTGILRVFSAFSYVLQTIIFAIVSGVTGYDAALGPNQTDYAKLGLNLQMSLIPMVIILIGTITFMLLYKISKEDAEANKKKLEEMGL